MFESFLPETRSMYLQKKGIGVSLENGLLTAFYWKRKGNAVRIMDSLFLTSLTLDDSVTLSPEDYQRLNGFLQQYGSKSDEVIVEIPRNAVLVRHLKFPALSDQDLEQMLNYEVERHVPFSKSDIYYDSQVLSRSEKEAQVLLVVAKKQLVDTCLDLVKTDRVKPTAVFISSFSLLNLLLIEQVWATDQLPLPGTPLQSPGPHIGIVAITSQYVEVSFISHRNLEGSLIIPIKEKPWQDLLKGGIIPAVTGAESYTYLLKSFTEWLVSEVSKAFLKQEFMEKGRVETLILVQPPLVDLELIQPFQRRLDIPVEVVDFSDTVKTKKDAQSPLLCSKAGLALIGAEFAYFNLDLFPKFLEVPKPPKLYFTGALVGMLLFLLGVSYFGKCYKERTSLRWVKEQEVSLEPQVKSILDMRDKLKDLKNHTEMLTQIENQSPEMLEILKELTLKTPEYAWLKGIKVNEAKVEIWGYSNHSKGGQASDLIRLFSDSVLFEKPSFSEPIQTIRQDTETFKMTMEISKSRPRQKAEESRDEKSGKKAEKTTIPNTGTGATLPTRGTTRSGIKSFTALDKSE
jgi:general secretion pathway protein L